MQQPPATDHFLSGNGRRVLGALAILFLLFAFIPDVLPVGTANYLPLHTVLEIAAVAVAFLVFIIGWRSWLQAPPLPITIIACGFLGVALLDVSHLLSYQGMPRFVTPSHPEKAINFWLAARTLAALALLLAACLSWDHTSRRWQRHTGLFVTLMAVALIHGVFLWGEELVPSTFDPDTGLTPFKIAVEYVLVGLYGVTALILWRRRETIRGIDVSALGLAVLVTALSELFFTLYTSVTDLYNLMGHVYKIIAYYFLYRALVASGIDLPYHRLEDARQRMAATLDAMPDMVFELDRDTVVHQFHSQQGELLMPPEQFLGRPLHPMLPDPAAEVTRNALEDVIRSGHTQGRQYRLTIDGEERWYELSGSRLKGSLAPEPRYLLLVRNITDRKRAEMERDRVQDILYTALDNLPLGLAINTVGGEVHFEYMNERFPAIYGVTREQLNEPDGFWKYAYRDPEQRDAMRRQVVADVESGDPDRMHWPDVPLTDNRGNTRYVTARNIPLPQEGLSLSLVTDVTEQHRVEEELRIAAAAFESQEGIIISDADRRVLRVNQAFTTVTGQATEAVRGQLLEELLTSPDDTELRESITRALQQTGHWRGELWLRHDDGQCYPQRTTLTAVRDSEGCISHYIADLIDTTALHEAEQQIEQLALFDPLTGLANRSRMLQHLQHVIARHQHGGQHGAVLYLDLDQFKTINDTLGHQAGDRLLVRVADILREQSGAGVFVARNGADEFMVIVERCGADIEEAASAGQKKAEHLLKAINGRYQIDGEAYYSTCSIGIAVFGQKAVDAIEVLKQADIAMNQAKLHKGQYISFFDPAMETALLARASLDRELREALHREQFVLWYQPKVRADGTVVGAEALIRWQHPEKGLLAPGHFIPEAEASGLIHDLEQWVLKTAIRQLQDWQQRSGYRHLTLNVNVTSGQFYRTDFVTMMDGLIADCPVDPGGLVLEFTEGTLIADIDAARERIEALRSRGIHFAIDDFGTGYSSLTYLSRLPLDQLKIDQSFV
ncbi:MAG: bifunctional diguanylate cyclase/phosphodiesterase, partial [Pseudomonadota bacterium]